MTTPKQLAQSAILAAFLIAISLALAWAARAGAVPGDWPTRITMILSTLMIAYYGNAIPKMILRSAAARNARRFAGWAFVLAGFAAAALWAVAPLDIATPASIAIVGGAVLLVFGYCLLARSPDRQM
jgi:hypothetical protein